MPQQRPIQLRILSRAFLNHAADDIVISNRAPQMDAHRLLRIEHDTRHAAYLAQDGVGNGPPCGETLQGARVETDQGLDLFVLTVWDEEGPIGEMDDGRYDDHACEERRMSLE